MDIGLWRTGIGYYGVMRLKSLKLDQMERCMCGKKEVNPYLTELLQPQSNMEEGITL